MLSPSNTRRLLVPAGPEAAPLEVPRQSSPFEPQHPQVESEALTPSGCAPPRLTAPRSQAALGPQGWGCGCGTAPPEHRTPGSAPPVPSRRGLTCAVRGSSRRPRCPARSQRAPRTRRWEATAPARAAPPTCRERRRRLVRAWPRPPGRRCPTWGKGRLTGRRRRRRKGWRRRRMISAIGSSRTAVRSLRASWSAASSLSTISAS